MTAARIRLALLLVLFGFLVSAASPEGPPSRVTLFPYASVRKGLEGTGYTVLSGEEVSPFRVDVLGTVEQGAAQPRMIVCRLSGDGFEKTGVLAAMSGSPVYVDGKLLGALAYAWPFSKEPLCGVTPAEDMVAITRDTAPAGGPGPQMTLSDFFQSVTRPRLPAARGGLPEEASILPDNPGLQRLSDEGFSWSVDAPSGGASNPGEPAEPPGPGGMIGVQLVSGDVQMAAYGTVTWVDGRDFLAFGHPFLNLGDVAMPVVGARVITPVPSLQRGFKLCAPTGPLGAVLQDRMTGIFGRFGEKAPGVDVEVGFERPGLARAIYRFRIVRHRQLTSMLLGGALNALWSAKEDSSTARTLALTQIALRPEGGPEVRLQDQTFSGVGAFAEAADFLSSASELLADNPYAQVPLGAIRLEAKVDPGDRTVAVESAWLDRNEVAPGERLRLSVRLRPFQSPVRLVNVDLPTADLPPGPVTFWVGGSFDVQKRLAAASWNVPQSAPALLQYMADLPSDNSLVVAASTASPAKVLQGRRLGDLPPSVEALMASSPSAASAQDSPSRVLWRRSVPGSGPVEGFLEVKVTVKEEGDHAP